MASARYYMVESVGVVVMYEERRHAIRAVTWSGLALVMCTFVIGCRSEESLQTASQNISVTETFDLVISGGRVIDPESGLDGIRDIGVRDGTVVTVSETPLDAAEVVDATGLVVAPGFIDLHAHGQDF